MIVDARFTPETVSKKKMFLFPTTALSLSLAVVGLVAVPGGDAALVTVLGVDTALVACVVALLPPVVALSSPVVDVPSLPSPTSPASPSPEADPVVVSLHPPISVVQFTVLALPADSPADSKSEELTVGDNTVCQYSERGGAPPSISPLLLSLIPAPFFHSNTDTLT